MAKRSLLGRESKLEGFGGAHESLRIFFERKLDGGERSPRGGIEAINLLPEDYARVAELNGRYADLPGDFADLTLVSLSERLDIAEILTLDSDFDVYRRFRKKPFCRIPLG